MEKRGRLRLQPILKPAWPNASIPWSRSDSGRVTIAAIRPTALQVSADDGQHTAWPCLTTLIPQLAPGNAVTTLVALDYRESWRVLLGFDDGLVAVLDSDHALLFCQVLHRQRVRGFCCQPLHQIADRPDIIVRYQDRLIFLDGSSFADLCNRQADYDLSDIDADGGDPLRFVQFHKFSVAGQDVLHDVIYCNSPLRIGRHLSPDPDKFQFITVGSPSFNMIALAECNRNRPANEVIAVAVRQGVDVARKLASNFFAFGRKILIDDGDEIPKDNTEDQNSQPAAQGLIERASTYTVNPLSTIGDVPNRIIQSIVADARQQWAACVDNLGRILLLDLRQFLFIRIWKGYREAQVAFSKTNDKTVPPMLFIYISNVELLEVWEIPFGKRIASKKIGKQHYLQPHAEKPLILQSDGSALFLVSLNFESSVSSHDETKELLPQTPNEVEANEIG